MSISSALKKLVTNLGGTPTKKTVEGLINEVADNVSGGGGDEGGGESDLFVIKVTSVDAENQNHLFVDKKYSEIQEAFDANKRLVFVYDKSFGWNADTTIATLLSYISGTFTFGSINIISGNQLHYMEYQNEGLYPESIEFRQRAYLIGD